MTPTKCVALHPIAVGVLEHPAIGLRIGALAVEIIKPGIVERRFDLAGFRVIELIVEIHAAMAVMAS